MWLPLFLGLSIGILLGLSFGLYLALAHTRVLLPEPFRRLDIDWLDIWRMSERVPVDRAAPQGIFEKALKEELGDWTASAADNPATLTPYKAREEEAFGVLIWDRYNLLLLQTP